jgi:hypothetical protein
VNQNDSLRPLDPTSPVAVLQPAPRCAPRCCGWT